MSQFVARGSQLIVDLLVLSLAYWLAFLFRFEFSFNLEVNKLLFFTWPYVVIFKYLVIVAFGVHRFAWRYVGLREAKTILASVATSSAVLVAIRLGFAPLGGYTKFVMIPLGVLVMDSALAFLGVAGVRVSRRLLAERMKSNQLPYAEKMTPTLLIGAGEAGVMVAREIRRRPDLGIDPVGFLDDDPRKKRTVMEGLQVIGATGDLAKVGGKLGVRQVLITLANASGREVRRITKLCEEAGFPAKIIPGLYEIVGGKVNLSRIRPVDLEDLLRRNPVHLEEGLVSDFVHRKVVMITGAGGSIGSELCRQVARYGPWKLILVERFENALFEIHRELVAEHTGLVIQPCIADINDTVRMERIFNTDRPDVVFHAAAHKHVPMMEWNPGEAIKNNILGTKSMADLAMAHRTGHFVLISTDKAVNPASVMGASKRVAELYVQGMAQRARDTVFVSVRFGNVLGSSGSVVRTFRQQIAEGGPVTVTHPDMKRYFMTIPEATQLVLQAAAMGEGGEVFILDMGEPVRILDLAYDLIQLSGLEPGKDIEVRITGIRPGEKLFEELATEAEHAERTRHAKIFIGNVQPTDLNGLLSGIEELSALKDQADEHRILGALKRVIPEYTQKGDGREADVIALEARSVVV